MRAAQPLCVDWFQVIVDLNRAGYSLQSVADAVGVAKSTLVGWKQGAEPRYSEGELLVSFWCEQMGRAREKLPLAAPGDWKSYHAK